MVRSMRPIQPVKSGNSPKNMTDRRTIWGIIVLFIRVVSIALSSRIALFQSVNATAVFITANQRMDSQDVVVRTLVVSDANPNARSITEPKVMLTPVTMMAGVSCARLTARPMIAETEFAARLIIPINNPITEIPTRSRG